MTAAPLPRRRAAADLARCFGRTLGLLARREVHTPDRHVGELLTFADGTVGRVYRETVLDDSRVLDPCVLVVSFRLRAVRGRGHRLFEIESLLNTPLFVGFPGFVSKLWLAHDDHDVYRGLYEWDGAQRAEDYARALWHVLAVVSAKGSIDYHVLAGLHRDDVLARAQREPAAPTPEEPGAWWQVVARR